MALDFSKKSDELFLELVNTKAKRALTKEEFTIGSPGAGTGTGGKNTTVQLTAAEAVSETLIGQSDFHYDRLDLAQVFTGQTLSFEVAESDTTTLDIVAKLAAKYNLGLSELDIESHPIDKDSKPTSVTLVSVSTGLVYTGSLDVTLTWASQAEDMATVMGDGEADGFEKPNVTPAE